MTADAPLAPAAARPAPEGRGARLLPASLILIVAVAAFVLRYVMVARGGGVLGDNGYDDGVHYAAADALVHGRLPYRDFLFLQPPGIVLLLAPFAWLGSVTTDPTGVLVARLAFLGLGGANAGLVAAVCRRYGWTAALVGGGTYAVLFPAVYGERSTLLEPLGTFALLVAILITRHGWARPRLATFLAGLPLGFAVSTKIWYLVPAVVLAAFLGRRALLLLAGAASATAIVCLPFFLADPADMVREVISDQLGRPDAALWTPYRRLESILGILHLDPPTPASDAATLWAFLPAMAGAVVATAIAATVRGSRLFPVLVVATSGVVLASPSYFPHYGMLVAAPLAVCAGLATGRIARLLRARALKVVLVVAVLACVIAGNAEGDTIEVSRPIPAARLTPVVAQVRGCVTSDDPGVLAAVDVLSRDLARGCTVWPDVTGYTYDRDDGRVHGVYVHRQDNVRWQRDLLAYLASGDAVIPHRRTTGMSAATRAALHRGGALVTAGDWHVWSVHHSPSISSPSAG
jgi:alpha-1,2-mannosyltransferase